MTQVEETVLKAWLNHVRQWQTLLPTQKDEKRQFLGVEVDSPLKRFPVMVITCVMNHHHQHHPPPFVFYSLQHTELAMGPPFSVAQACLFFYVIRIGK